MDDLIINDDNALNCDDTKKDKKQQKAEKKQYKKQKKLENKNMKKQDKINKVQEKDNSSKKKIDKQIIQRGKKLKKQKEKNIMEIRNKWYKLDNAALIYPAICNEEWNSVFRLSVVLKDPVDKSKLQQALDMTIERFPFFNVSLREGLFWHYFQQLSTKPIVEEESQSPCRPFIFKKNSHILRVLYYNTKISFEIFHSLSDGYGAIQFFNVLIITYLELTGVQITDKSDYGYSAYDKTTAEESEDSVKRYYNKTKIRSRAEHKAYAIKDDINENDFLKVFNATTSLAELKSVAKKWGATINEFLSAVYLCTLLDHKKKYNSQNKKPVKLSVPVNIRRHLPSKTMRNFSLVLNVEIPHEKTDASFDEILQIVKNEMKNLTKDYIYGFIGKNVQSEKNFLVRILPLFIKKPIIRFIYSQIGEILFTSTISNMGIVKLPKAASDNIKEYQAILGTTKLNRINLAVISIEDVICLSVTTKLKDNALVKDFFNRLSDFNLHLVVESNI